MYTKFSSILWRERVFANSEIPTFLLFSFSFWRHKLLWHLPNCISASIDAELQWQHLLTDVSCGSDAFPLPPSTHTLPKLFDNLGLALTLWEWALQLWSPSAAIVMHADALRSQLPVCDVCKPTLVLSVAPSSRDWNRSSMQTNVPDFYRLDP